MSPISLQNNVNTAINCEARTLVLNDQPSSMDQHTTRSKPLHNSKAENLKSKIDLLIMNRTKAMAPGPAEAEENIQSIQEEINHLFTGRLNVGVTPSTPAVDAKKSSCAKPPMSPAKAGDSQFHMNHSSTGENHSKLVVNHSTTVENVEHLLETMFQDNKNSSVKTNVSGSLGEKKSKTSTFPNANSNRSNTLSTKANTHIANTNSSKANIIPDSRNVERLLETMFQDTKAVPEKPADPKQNVEHLLESMFQEKTSPRHSTRKSNTPTPRNSLSVEAIENILRTPSPENDEDETNVKPSTRLNTNSSRCNNLSTSSLSTLSPRLANNTRQSTRSSRLRNRSSQSTLSSHDESSNDSTKLEIVDDSLIKSESLNWSATSDLKSYQTNQGSRNSNHRLLNDKKSLTDLNGKDANDLVSTSCDKPNELFTIKQERPSQSPSTKASLKQLVAPQITAPSPGSPAIQHSNMLGSKSSIVAVENELEKMFAGIVREDEEQKEMNVEMKKENGWVDSTPASRKDSQNKRRRSSEFFASSPEPSTSSTPSKRKKLKQSLSKFSAGKKKGSQPNIRRHSLNAKDTSNDSLNTSAKTSGVLKVPPFVRLYADRTEAVVVNSVAKEEAVISGTQAKKPADFVPNKKMRSSAQSNLQPANRTDVVDPSWFCVFCKRGPNTHGPAGNPLGDLYGPYRIGPPQDGHLDGDDFKRRVARGVGKSEIVKKKRTVSSDIDASRLTVGLTRVTLETNSSSWDIATKSSSVQYEVWFHETCVVWASGVCLVQGSLLGLDESVWAALNSTCMNCGETGASIGCVKSKCRSSVHYGCALHIGWYLDPTTFVATCSVHRAKYVPERYLETPGNDVLL